ncbi:hypothetical protein Golax_019187 [Gossypium laxum]|uniref:DUF4283 domain-containing protein n=1 Tax=Gossypium laxum TaxID=34288 RepID=A0A7J8Z698_9ROSI|nr:hypothetical protein [Gossypium laxum]
MAMEEEMAGLNINDGKEEVLSLQIDVGSQTVTYELCLVGCFLTANMVHFSAIKNIMANLWHPLGGVQISDLRERRYLFKFYHEIDIERVINGTPWTFNNYLLVVYRVGGNEDPM